MESKKNRPIEIQQGESSFKEKVQKKYVQNVVKVEEIQVSRVVIKAPSNIYDPDFDNDVGLWEQYWLNGRKLLERKINANEF